MLYTSFADLLTRTFLIMLRLNEFTAFCEDSSSRAVVSCLVTNVQTDSNEFDILFRCATRNCVKLYESVIASVVQTSSWSVQCALQNTRRYSKLTFQAQNSPFPQIFSIHHSLLAPTWTALFLYWTGLTLLNCFSFLVIFYFGLCGRLSWLNCQLSSAR